MLICGISINTTKTIMPKMKEKRMKKRPVAALVVQEEDGNKHECHETKKMKIIHTMRILM